MKFIATLLIAAVFASAVMADEAPAKGIKATIAAKAEKIRAKINHAVDAGKMKAAELYKQYGPERKQALAKLNELNSQFNDKLEEVVIPAYGKARERAVLKLKAELIKKIEVAQAKLQELQ